MNMNTNDKFEAKVRPLIKTKYYTEKSQVNCKVRGISNHSIKSRTVKSDPYCKVLSNLKSLVCSEQFSESNSHKSKNEVFPIFATFYHVLFVSLYSQVF